MMHEHRFYQTLLLSEDKGSPLKIGWTKLEEGTARLEPVLLHSKNQAKQVSYNGRGIIEERQLPKSFETCFSNLSLKDFVLCALFSPQSECHLALTGELSGRSAEILAINAK